MCGRWAAGRMDIEFKPVSPNRKQSHKKKHTQGRLTTHLLRTNEPGPKSGLVEFHTSLENKCLHLLCLFYPGFVYQNANLVQQKYAVTTRGAAETKHSCYFWELTRYV